LIVQADGKILVGGSGYYGTNYNQTIVRYEADGAIDGSFGVSGKKQGEVVGNVTCKIAVQNDGKIIIGGGNIIARYYP